MNDEIKEILDYWQFYINEPNNYKLLNVHFDEIKKVLDYITNLQKENEELKQDNIIGCKKFIKQRQIIDKAIEWVKEHIETYQKNEIVILDWDNFSDPRNLLKILGGDE